MRHVTPLFSQLNYTSMYFPTVPPEGFEPPSFRLKGVALPIELEGQKSAKKDSNLPPHAYQTCALTY